MLLINQLSKYAVRIRFNVLYATDFDFYFIRQKRISSKLHFDRQRFEQNKVFSQGEVFLHGFFAQ